MMGFLAVNAQRCCQMKKKTSPVEIVTDRFSGIVPAPFGAVGFSVRDGCVSVLSFLTHNTVEKKVTDSLSREVSRQLIAYFADPTIRLDFPVSDPGTDFQKKVWREMRNIPVGKTRTYGDLAHRLQTAPRAVGGACAVNPLVLYYPCHRIVAAGGIGGFSGEKEADGVFVRIKRWLLEHEGVLKNEQFR